MMQNVMTNAALWRIHPFWGQWFFRSVGFSETGFVPVLPVLFLFRESRFFIPGTKLVEYGMRFWNCMKEDVKA